MRSSSFPRLAFWLTMVFFYAPLCLLVAVSFNDTRGLPFNGVSLRWYRELFGHSPALWAAFRNSALIALTSSLAATVLGSLAAIGIYRYRFAWRRLLQAFTFLPLILPEIILGVSFLIFFAAVRLPLGLFTVFIAHTTFNLPFVLLIVLARLEEFDHTIIEAAYDLGADEPATLRRVLVPLALPGILAAFLMAITLSLEDFVITFFVAGPGSSTLPVYIYSLVRFGVSPVINALSGLLVAGTFLVAFALRGMYKYYLGTR